MPRVESCTRSLVLDFRRETHAPLIQKYTRISSGEVALCDITFESNHGAYISTSQLVVSIHRNAPYELIWHEGSKIKKRLVRPGVVHFSPPGVPTFMQWNNAEPSVMALTVDRTKVLRILGSTGADLTKQPPTMLATRDPMMRQLIERCIEEMVNSDSSVRAYTDALITTLVTHIYRTYAKSGSSIIVKGGLTPKQTNHVLAYIREHLRNDIGVDVLATEAGLSNHYFTEAFRKTIGVTPYRYLLNQRIERAIDMLRESRLPIAKIAEGVGFSSHAQLSRHFRNIIGVTPTRFRREVQ